MEHMEVAREANLKKVLIIDDHALISEAVKRYLESRGQYAVREAADLTAGLEMIAQDGPFDIVLLDMVMPGMNGLNEVASVVNAAVPGRVIIFSGNVKEEIVSKALDLGAYGYIPKSLPLRSLPNTIELVCAGERFVPVDFIFRHIKRGKTNEYDLNENQIRLLSMISTGKTNKEIAWEIGISEASVKMHLRAIYQKLGATNRAHAVITAKQVQLL